jgi:translation initiation factor 2A
MKKPARNIPGQTPKPAAPVKKPPPTEGPVAGGLMDNEKKIKGINKKLKQISDLKLKKATGVPLELTQISKIESEAGLKKEVFVK